jgi:hypothetical protein
MSEELNVTQDGDAPVNQVRLIVAQVGAKFVTVGPEGILVSELPNYDSTMTYMVGPEVVGPDFRLLPGVQVFSSQPHSNG